MSGRAVRIWPLRLAAREGIATARSGRWTSLLMVVAVAWTVAAPGAADAIAVTDLREAERAWIDAGGYVFVVTGARDQEGTNPIPAPACDGLSRMDGVEASFALTNTGAMGSLGHVPGGRASLYDVSPGAAGFLGAQPAATGVVMLTAGFAERTGVRDGEVVTVVRRSNPEAPAATSDPLTARVVASAVMGDEYDGSLLVPARLEGDADACFVRTDAAHYQAVAAALPAYLAYDGQPAIPNPRLFASDFTVDYTHSYEQRPLRWLWVPSAALLGLLWGMLQWFRRSHVAIYATFGMRAAPRLVMQAAEWGVLATIGAIWGLGIGMLGAVGLGARVADAACLVGAHAVLTLAASGVLVVLLGLRPTGTLLHALKDR